jgi:hypothetical protein
LTSIPIVEDEVEGDDESRGRFVIQAQAARQRAKRVPRMYKSFHDLRKRTGVSVQSLGFELGVSTCNRWRYVLATDQKGVISDPFNRLSDSIRHLASDAHSTAKDALSRQHHASLDEDNTQKRRGREYRSIFFLLVSPYRRTLHPLSIPSQSCL